MDLSLLAIYHRLESGKKKKRQYSLQVKEVEHGIVCTLVFLQLEECSTLYRQPTDMTSTKQEKVYSLLVSWPQTRLSYASTRAAVMCICGNRSLPYLWTWPYPYYSWEVRYPQYTFFSSLCFSAMWICFCCYISHEMNIVQLKKKRNNKKKTCLEVYSIYRVFQN